MMTDRERLIQAIMDLLNKVPERAIRFVYSFLLEWIEE